MKRSAFVLTLTLMAATLSVAAPASAQAPGQSAPSDVSGVVVEAAPRTRDAARRYVDRIAAPPANAISLATWQTPLCIDVRNFTPTVSQALVERIHARATRIGVEIGKPGCVPNVFLLGTSDGRATAQEALRFSPAAFKTGGGDTQLGPDALRAFEEGEAPVRWWTLAAQYDTATRTFAEALWRQPATRRETGAGAMFNATLVRAMLQEVVIVDASRTAGVPVEALGDYLAMVILAEVDANADLGAYPTVLKLWRPGGERSRMTAWDERYLTALYCAKVRQPGMGPPIRSLHQLSDIARHMAERPNVRRMANGKCR